MFDHGTNKLSFDIIIIPIISTINGNVNPSIIIFLSMAQMKIMIF